MPYDYNSFREKWVDWKFCMSMVGAFVLPPLLIIFEEILL